MNAQNSLAKQITQIYIYVIATAYLLLTGFNGYQQIASFKALSFLMLGSIYIILMICISSKEIIKNRKLSLSQILVLFYLAFSWIAWAVCDYRSASLIGASRSEGIITITIYCLSFLFISIYGEIDKTFVKVFSATVICFCLIGIVQLFGLNPFNLYPAGINYLTENNYMSWKFISTIGNIDHVSAFIAPASLALLITAIKNKERGLPSFAGLLALILLFSISVSSGILAFIIGLLLIFPCSFDISPKLRKTIYIVIAILLILTLIAIYIIDIKSGSLHEMHQILHGNIQPSFGSGRIKIWQDVLKHMPGHYLFGHGPDTMIFDEITPWLPVTDSSGFTIKTIIDAAHNEYLNVLYSQGILSLVAFCGAITATIIKAVKKSNLKGTASLALLSYIIVYSIQAFFNISVCFVSIYFWIALGLLECESNSQLFFTEFCKCFSENRKKQKG